jgi:hypothetical protein
MSAEAIAALRTKGAELSAERDALLRGADALAADLASFNRVIAILDPAQAGASGGTPGRRSGAKTRPSSAASAGRASSSGTRSRPSAPPPGR